jgi:hypothetical protein
VKLPLAAYPIQDCLQRMSTPKCIATWSSTMAMKALRILWSVKGENDGNGKDNCHTTKNKKAQRWDTGTSSVVIPPQMMECLNKTEVLYYAWGEEYYENPKNAGIWEWSKWRWSFLILNNIKGKPLIGKQYLALWKFVDHHPVIPTSLALSVLRLGLNVLPIRQPCLTP